MKTVAQMALTPGMELAEDVYSYKNELLIPADTVLDVAMIARLGRYSIMCVSIKEEADYAVTHFEKVHVSETFRRFEKEYQTNMAVYKLIMNDFLEK